MNHWKWSKGEPYYKSARPEKKQQQVENCEYDSQKNALNQSLADETFLNMDSEMIDITNSMFSRSEGGFGTRREDLDVKMADRELVSQRGVNPFLQTSYVNDIVTRDMFLKPINTTQGRTKNSNSNDNNELS
jgi:hypothetical protein